MRLQDDVFVTTTTSATQVIPHHFGGTPHCFFCAAMGSTAATANPIKIVALDNNNASVTLAASVAAGASLGYLAI